MAKEVFKVSGARKIRKKELIPFTRQMASMLNAGMSILASVSTLEEQSTNASFRQVLRQLRDVIESGSPFSEGLSLFPQIFDDMYVSSGFAGAGAAGLAGSAAGLAAGAGVAGFSAFTGSTALTASLAADSA